MPISLKLIALQLQWLIGVWFGSSGESCCGEKEIEESAQTVRRRIKKTALSWRRMRRQQRLLPAHVASWEKRAMKLIHWRQSQRHHVAFKWRNYESRLTFWSWRSNSDLEGAPSRSCFQLSLHVWAGIKHHSQDQPRLSGGECERWELCALLWQYFTKLSSEFCQKYIQQCAILPLAWRQHFKQPEATIWTANSTLALFFSRNETFWGCLETDEIDNSSTATS